MSRGEIVRRVETYRKLLQEGRHQEASAELKRLHYALHRRDRIRSVIVVIGLMLVIVGLLLTITAWIRG